MRNQADFDSIVRRRDSVRAKQNLRARRKQRANDVIKTMLMRQLQGPRRPTGNSVYPRQTFDIELFALRDACYESIRFGKGIPSFWRTP